MSDLDRLIEAVDAEKLTRQMCEEFFPQRHEHPDEDPANHMSAAYHGSLDAAKALHEALLPGWAVDRISQDREGYWCVILMTKVEPWQASTAIQADFARAWLLAILKAYRSTQ